MAVLSKDDFFSKLHDKLGDDTSDDSIAFLEDMTDTYNDLEKKAVGDGTDWEKKYHDLDESWKKRYRHRFFSEGGECNPNNSDADTENNSRENITVDELFEVKK